MPRKATPNSLVTQEDPRLNYYIELLQSCKLQFKDSQHLEAIKTILSYHSFVKNLLLIV